MDKEWWLYIIECRGGGLYIGITIDVDNRYQKHSTGYGALYTRLNPPVKLLASVSYGTRKEATQMERYLKKLPRTEKWRWVKAFSRNIGNNKVS